MKKNLAIFSPNQNSYSETFIQAHKKLPFNIKFYHEGYLPSSLEGHGNIVRFDIVSRIRNRFNKNITIAEQSLINSLKSEKVDFVLAEYGPTACHVLEVIKKLGLPMVVCFFGYDVTHKPTIEIYHEKYKQVFAYASSIVVVSKKMKEDIIQLGCSERKVTINYCSPNDIFYKAKPLFETSNFIAVGRFVNKKAPYLTIAAFKKVVSEFPLAKLTMVGEGLLLNTCKNLVNVWGLEKNVEFAGIKSPEEIVNMFETSLAFVQHSVTAEDGDSEGTPVAVLDAQAAALPVISTWHAGIPDVVIHNETGLLSNEFDVEAMTLNMLRLIKEKKLAQKLGKAGRERVINHFSMEKNLITLKNLIERGAD